MMLSPDETTALVLSLRVAAVATLATLVPGTLVAGLLARTRMRGKIVLDALVSAPLVLPPVVTGYLLLRLLGRNGLVGRLLAEQFGVVIAFTWLGAAIAAGVVAFPLFVRAVRVALENAHVGLEDAARTFGAGRVRVLFGVTLPLALPGLVGGAVLAFARSLGEFGATITFAGNIAGTTRTLPLAIFSYTQSPGGDEPAMRLAMLSLLLSVLAIAASQLFSGYLRRIWGMSERARGSREAG